MPESSVMGSFWGKSPLYQSTPAFEIGKTAATSLMTSKFDEQDLTAGATNMVTPRVHRPLVDVQRTVIFRDFCCLGVSEKTWFPITNKSAYGLVCRLQVLQVVHNNRPSKLDIYSPFELKSKISIAPEASEDIPVLFVPKCPGEHVAHVEVLAQSLNPAFAPTCTIIQLRATAEAPSIQISPPVEVLEFGEVMWGTCQTRSIKLRNLKRASLPVRLSIWSSDSVWHCFTFDNSANSSDISIISLSTRPEALGRNIFTVQVPGCENEGVGQVIEIRLYCKPPTKEKNRALAERPAEKIGAKVLVEVDTPVQYLPALGTLTLQAIIGMPHLLIPPTHMSLKFKTEPERTIQETICLNNAGNISMELALGVTIFPDCFQVKPRHVAIKPRSKADVIVTFSPLEKDVNKYQSLLLLDIEPEGPSYELPMEARVVQPVHRQRTSPSILSSSSFLSFNGVALNQTKSLTLRLLNNDSQRTEHVLLEIRGATDCFKLVTPTGEWQQRSELLICPKQKQVVTVMFCPSAVRGYSSKLLIRIRDSGSSKYSIPLAGYGGRSVLTLSGACLTNYNQRWLELGPLSVGHNIMQDIVLTNSGVRAAFIKASSFYDMACREPVIPGRVAVEPNNIVLAPGSSVKVMVAISPSKRERDMVKERKEMIAVVRFQHGDEVMRQKYQKVLAHDGRDDLNSWQASFAQQFANESMESIIKEGCTIPESPDDGPAFLHHLSTQIVALLAEPHPERDVLMEPVHVLHSQRLPKPSSGSSEGIESVVSRDTLKQYDPSGQFLIPNKPNDVDTEWIVKPDFLTLTVGESNQKMLQLLNFSRSNLRFELSWPSNSVVPEPQKGEVKPRSSVSIEVWLHMAWQKRITELPWHGNLTVICNGKQKLVKVHIKNAALKPPLAVVSPTSLESMSTVSKLLPVDAHLSASSQSLQITSTNINFPCARVNESLESVIELTNISSDPVHWKIQAFAPAYVKGADENNTVQRVGYSVFQIIPISGDLLPHESSKVPIKFCPKTRGTYNQHWEIEYQPLVGGKSVPVVTTTKIFITAEASSTENPVTAKQISGKGSLEIDKPQQRAPLQEKQHNTMRSAGEHHHTTVQDLLLLNPEVKFCDTVVGKVTQVKVEFKNSYDTNIQLGNSGSKVSFLRQAFKFWHNETAFSQISN
ncbi:centrosomal protein of 192 kDa-like [Pomacea canaliculata]|uniref:centrosomal protein of 192 kDa-like n=1 Tax=Pomacea canaliculata TaxID=400727 RepID=UPI000D73CBF3|nr:centrosomal protein of 192 kDa-like [Pomacea canaliculata]